MKYVIWGAGLRGERLFKHLNREEVVAFVDKSSEKIGTFFCGKRVISLEQYAKQYRDSILVITHTFEYEGIEELKEMGIASYMRLSDCPGEFQAENVSDYLENYIKSIVNMNDTYGILGCTIYGLQVYSWIVETGNKCSYIIVEQDIPSEIIELIQRNGYRVVTKSEVALKQINKILDCRYVETADKNNTFSNLEYKNIYDCSDDIKQYYNPKIEKLKDIHKNECCFIVATGPSLKIEDLNVLWEKNVLSFGVNKIGYAYDSTKWRPTYYVGIDKILVESEYFTTIKPEEQSLYAFIGEESEIFWQKKHGTNVLRHHFCSEWAFGRYPKFSEDLSRKSYTGGTVVYICIQLAVYMGFHEIYLLGVDFTGAEEHGSRYNHFYLEKELTSVSYTNQVRAAYEKARKYADEHGIKIYNATRGGKLEIFERVDFDTLFAT